MQLHEKQPREGGARADVGVLVARRVEPAAPPRSSRAQHLLPGTLRLVAGHARKPEAGCKGARCQCLAVGVSLQAGAGSCAREMPCTPKQAGGGQAAVHALVGSLARP